MAQQRIRRSLVFVISYDRRSGFAEGHGALFTPLTTSFLALYEIVRIKRNTFAHGVAKGERIAAIDILKYIVETFEQLHPGCRWPSVRLEYLQHDPAALANGHDHSHPRLLKEMERVLDSLTPAASARFFNVRAKARWYMCPGTCFLELQSDEFANGDAPHFAQLVPPRQSRSYQSVLLRLWRDSEDTPNEMHASRLSR